MNHLFSEIRANMPDSGKTFLETQDGRRITYGDILTLSARYANALTDLGVGPGDRVAVQVEKTPEALMLYLATVRAAGFSCP